MAETVTILDQSGKVVKTSKEIFSIFKDAKDIYKERKQELRQNAQLKLDTRSAPQQQLLAAAPSPDMDSASVASTARSHRSRTSSASATRERSGRARVPLTAEVLSQIDERHASDASSVSSPSHQSKEGSDPARPYVGRRHSACPPASADRTSALPPSSDAEPRPRISRRHTGMQQQSEVSTLPAYREVAERSPRSPRSSRPRLGERVDSVLGSFLGGSSATSRAASTLSLSRRHTELALVPSGRTPNPPSYSALGSNGLLNRSNSVPDFHGENIDMNLAYGKMPGPSRGLKNSPQELELRSKVSKIDTLLMEAHCLQGTATAIISKLQSNPEAMAAVALTLAQVSSMLKNFSPAMTQGLKMTSPATFALLASPQFMIAGGVAAGITVVAFGGYKIIKKMAEQKLLEAAAPPQEALAFEGTLGSIDSWRRGVSVAGSDGDDDTSTVFSVGTSVEGEIITPEANRRREERRRDRCEARTVASSRSRPSVSRSKTTSRSLAPSERSSRSESRSIDDKTEPRRGEDKLGNALIVRPRAERSSSARSVASARSSRVAVEHASGSTTPITPITPITPVTPITPATSVEAPENARRQAEEEDDDSSNESKELVMYKKTRHRKSSKDETASTITLATEIAPAVVVDKSAIEVGETDEERQRRREDREKRRRERKERGHKTESTISVDEKPKRSKPSRRETLSNLLTKSTISEKESVIVKSEKTHHHRRAAPSSVGA